MTRPDKPAVLSKRLKTLADMVPAGKRVADVGCDHGFLDIYLLQSGRASGAIAMDVRKGPLSAAAQHIREAGLEESIETRLSDGLENYRAGEAEVLVCAGMGGPLMQRILSDDPEKTESFQEMILQPQSELREFRIFLREAGYTVLDEEIVFEDGKYYFPMRVRPGRGGKLELSQKEILSEEDRIQREIFDRYGEMLVRRREPILMQYLDQQNRILEDILEKLRASDPREERRRQRLMEVEKEREMLQEAIRQMRKNNTLSD